MRAQRKQIRVRPPLPSDILKETVMDRLGITQDQLAVALDVSRVTVNQIMNGKRGISAEMALRLGHVTSTSPTLWLNLQRELDLFDAHEGLNFNKLSVLRKPSPTSSNKAEG